MEEAQSRAIVTERRKAWAKSRDSWQASEAEDVSAERGHIPRAVQAKLRLADGSGNIPNEKIAIWLNDCRTPLGASLDEQSSALPGFPKGMIIKNGNSFEDDLSLGAEANHLHQRFLPMEPTFNGMLAQDRRLQFHQKGRSMNSTGSGKSSATVSSVSELLDLYEEDPEEILYNLGFGRDEPDIASKIPPRFFNNSSFANGIDIKVFLNAQMQRLELENPNYALTSRFRQIKVLTEVANAFSSLYSQVSGTPLQQIGSSKSLTTSTTTSESKPAPLTRSSSQTAARLMETLSKLNLCGTRPLGETNNTSQSLEDKGPNETGNDDESHKSDQKVLKPFKPLATVKEEVPNSSANDTGCLDVSVLPKENGVSEMLAHSSTNGEERPSTDLNECDISIVGSPTNKDLSVSTDQDCEHYLPEKNPSTSTPERERCLTNPSISGLIKQDKESFELEELQSAEEEPNQVPPRCRLTLEKIGKDNLLRTASQHSDSSGFAEDTSGDCVLTNSLPGQDSLQAMGSSADSYDSETTVTSIGEDLRTPLALDERESIDLDEFLTPVDLERNKFFPEQEPDTHSVKVEVPNHQNEELKSSEDLNSAVGDPHELSEEDSDLQHECTADSELEMNSEYESISYTTHHISEALDSFPEYDRFHGLDSSDTRSLDRVSVALQRAQKKILSSGTSDSRAGRGMITSRDLLKRRHKFTSCGYPLRRTQSLPSPLLSPVRVVSKVNIVIHSGKATVCSPPSFSYRYTPEEEDDLPEQTEELGTKSKSTVFRSPVSDTTDAQKSGMERMTEDLICRSQSCNAHAPSHRSHSSCSLHSSQFDWHERPLCEHARAWSTHSVPNFSGASCGPLIPPFSCSVNQRFGYGSLHRSCSGCSLPLTSPPSTTEMQLRRVLHDIRSSLQNLSQHPVIRGHDLTSGGYSQKSSILSLYENTFQELQIMRRSLNLFRTQMMDLELNMLRQQTMVYPHLTEEERYEADQLQGLRNSVRIELQELELQLDERLLTLEEQLRSFQVSSPFQRQAAVGMYGGRGSTDSLVFSSGLNVMEPVNELIREQSHLKSELGLDSRLDHGADRCESVFSQAPSDSSSVCSTPHKHRKGPLKSSDSVDKFKAQTPPGKSVYRATVALTPSPPTRAGGSQSFADESPEGPGSLKLEPAEKRETEFYSPVAEGGSRWSPEENQELQQVIREIKEAIVGDIRREIVSGLLAAVSSPVRSMDGKNDGRI